MPKKPQNNTKAAAAKSISKVSTVSKNIVKQEKKQTATLAQSEEKWARSQLQMNDWFSCHQYMKFESIKGERSIQLTHQSGKKLSIDIDVLVNDSYSADHYAKEVNCNMTELSDILKDAKDTIFKVEFKKKVDDKQILEKLSAVKASDLKKAELIKSLSKGIIEGENVTIIGHLVKSEQHMGRSLIIDLESSEGNNFRQVDHRTIQSIILKNIKYNLNKKSNLSTFEQKYTKGPKWDKSKLSVGNWFSEMQYYQCEAKDNSYFDCRIYNENKDVYSIPGEQLYDMYSSTIFAQEEKLTRTNMLEVLMNAKDCVLTVTFRTKVSPKDIEEVLSSIKSDKQLKADSKALSKQMVEGKLTTIAGFLVKSEEKLGRSTIIDLSADYGKGWRQVDHRTIEELIIKNTKYTLKK